LEILNYTDYLRLSVKDHFVLLLDRHYGNLFSYYRSKKENTIRGLVWEDVRDERRASPASLLALSEKATKILLEMSNWLCYLSNDT
jgi:hypothetical protein